MRNWRILIGLLAAMALMLAACGSDDDSDDTNDDSATADDSADDDAADDDAADDSADDSADDADGGEELTGSVNLDGSSTVGPFQEVAAELFMEANPGVRVTVAISGTGGGFEKFCIGETDGSNASRYIKESEEELCQQNDIAYDFIQVANDALSVVVNNDNPVDCMTVEQVRQAWDDGTTVANWGDIEGLDVGDLAGTAVTLYGPGTDSGTFDFFTEEINGESGRIGRYIDIGEDDTAAVVGVQGDVGAMAFIPFSYYQESLGDVKGIAIDDGNGCVEPTPENVLNLSYTPLGRGLFTYFSDTALAKPETLAFAEFVLDNAPEIAEFAEFVPLTEEQIAAEREKVAALAAGN